MGALGICFTLRLSLAALKLKLSCRFCCWAYLQHCGCVGAQVKNSDTLLQLHMLVPSGLCGALIGKGGATIDLIR